MVDKDKLPGYKEDQKEQTIVITFSGTGPNGIAPAREIDIRTKNINHLQKIQGALRLMEIFMRQPKDDDESVSDLVTDCMLARFEKFMKEEKNENI